MKSKMEIDSKSSKILEKAVSPSLESDEGVKIKVLSKKEQLDAEVEADTLGRLRGGTDAVFRLAGLSKKIIER